MIGSWELTHETRRVVITGMGVVTSLGETVDAFWDALCAGKSGIGPITRFDTTEFPRQFGGECTTSTSPVRRRCRARPSGSTASRSSPWPPPVRRSRTPGIDFAKEDADRCGVIIGSRHRRARRVEEQHTIADRARGRGRVSPFTIPKLMVNAASGNVSIRFGLRGPEHGRRHRLRHRRPTPSATPSRLIQHDDADVMITGGTEAALYAHGPGRLLRRAGPLRPATTIPPRASRPFDKDRDGFVLAEGAGILDPRRIRARQEPRRADLRRSARLRHERPTPATSPQPDDRRHGRRPGHEAGA